MDELKRLRDHHPDLITLLIADEHSDEPGNLKLCRRTLLVDLLHIVNAQAMTVTARKTMPSKPAPAASTRTDVSPPVIATIGREPAAASAERQSPITALIAEADAAIRVELRNALDRVGIKTVEASNAAEASSHARHQHFDLAMLDVDLEPIDGFQLCHDFRVDPSTRTLPVLLLSRRASINERARAVTAGCQAFLVRPLDTASLYDAIDRLLTRAFHNDRLQMKQLGYQAPTQGNDSASTHELERDCPA